MKRICVFCGSSRGDRSIYAEKAAAIGRALVYRGYGLIYGGGNVGLMGTVADAVLAAGGEAIGVLPRFLADKEIAHAHLTELHLVESMHDRKALMAELADGFIALPGGFGTIEEFAEVLTWAQLGLHQKPMGLLNVGGYYDALLEFFDRAVEEGFLLAARRAIVLEASEPHALLDQMIRHQPQKVDQWINRSTQT